MSTPSFRFRLPDRSALWPSCLSWRGAGWNRAALLVWAAAASSACGSSTVQQGAEFYVEGRYIDADQVFEQTELQLPSFAADERAQYGLYRGATLLALGDHERARRWLAYGARFDQAVYSSSQRSLLVRSLREASSAPPRRFDDRFAPAPGSMGLAATPARLSP